MYRTRIRVLFGGVAAVVVSALVLVACGGGSAPQPAAQQATAPASQAQAPAQAAQPAPAATPAPAEAAPAAAATPAPAAAASPAAPSSAFVQEHETGVEVTLVEARRTAGDSVTVKWRYRNTLPNDVKIAKGGSSWTDPYLLTMSAFLIDPMNKKKYLVITDSERNPLTSKHGDWQGVTLAPGQVLSSWAKFPAPPPGVEKVTITLPGVPPYEDVPIVK